MDCYLTLALLALFFLSGSVASLTKPTISSEERLHHLKSACSGSPPWANLTGTEKLTALQHILVNEQYNILYCYVPKVACSNWKRVIMVLDGKANDTNSIQAVDHFGFVRLDSFPPEAIKYRLQHYYKFMFVRDPLDRLVSAYKDKLTGGSDYYNNAHVKKMVQSRNSDQYTKTPAGTKGATLMEFFKYLETSAPAAMDEHWMPYYQLCQPCIFDYDFIGSMENLDEDAREVLLQMNVDDLVEFPRKQRMYTYRVNNPSTAELLARIPRWMLGRIVHIYRKDYELFSYDKPKLGPD